MHCESIRWIAWRHSKSAAMKTVSSVVTLPSGLGVSARLFSRLRKAAISDIGLATGDVRSRSRRRRSVIRENHNSNQEFRVA